MDAGRRSPPAGIAIIAILIGPAGAALLFARGGLGDMLTATAGGVTAPLLALAFSTEVLAVDIAYASRSRFLEACEDAIRAHRAELDAGGVVLVALEEGGYGGTAVFTIRALVTIRANDHATFGTDWERADPTRFPARIKAAATALLNCGCEGRFVIAHVEGSLAIRSV